MNGIADAWWSSQLNMTLPTNGSQETVTLNQTPTPAGTYLINATVEITGNSGSGFEDCVVPTSDMQVIQPTTNSGREPGIGTMSLSSAGDVTMTCTSNVAGSSDVQIYAQLIRVAALH
jgi:hypothetical protein